MAEERLATEKRKQAAQEMKEHREKVAAANNESDDVLDSLLEKLRNGEGVGRKSRRTRGPIELQPAIPLTLQLDSNEASDTADIARDMLANLQSDGVRCSHTFPYSTNKSFYEAEDSSTDGGSCFRGISRA